MAWRTEHSRATSVLLGRHRRAVVVACPRPWHGLGNRMRVHLGARILARLVDRTFAYAWPVDHRFGARLDELWDVADPLLPSWWPPVLSLRHPYRDATLSWLSDARDDVVWQIRTPHALALPSQATTWERELQTLRPVHPVAERATRFRAQELGATPYLGVMVRSHSVAHTQTLAASPLDWYKQRLREIRSAFPSLPFFISADTDEASREISAQIPNCVALMSKGGYNSRAALQSSVVDLYLLAGSVHILGAHYSSFPELARNLGGDGIVLETSQTPSPMKFENQVTFSQPADVTAPHLRSVVRLTA